MGRNKGDKGDSTSRERSRSPVDRSDQMLTEADLRRIVSESMKQQIPSLIVETSKVVAEQLSADTQEAQTKSLSSFSQEMKLLKARQEEVAYQSKAAALKGEGIIFRYSYFLICLFF